MTDFLQVHLLTSYPPACLNRDDLNRPKTAIVGGIPRLRISSQSLKRAWRKSEVFAGGLSGHMGIRSKELGRKIRDALLSGITLGQLLGSDQAPMDPDGTVSEADAKVWAQIIAGTYVDKKEQGDSEDEELDEAEKPVTGKPKKEKKQSNVSKETLKSEQIVFYSPAETRALEALITELRRDPKRPSGTHLASIKVESAGEGADVALFGRMLASDPRFNVEAAAQVAHAFTVHRAPVEDDYFTAVDDLNTREDAGAAHLGDQGYGAGLFYLYLCINCDLLEDNLEGDVALKSKAIRGLVEAAATVAPTGKQNSFASRAWATYVLAERGSRQPRSLSVAYLSPVRDGNMLQDAIDALESTRAKLDKVYHGGESLPSRSLNAVLGEGDFPELLEFAAAH